MTDIILLDGSIGQELVNRYGGAPPPLWATAVMDEAPGVLHEVHDAYFAAGASVATANTYVLHHDRVAGTALEGQLPRLTAQALAVARAARDRAGHGAVAGSIGPLVESYRSERHPPHAEAVPLYAERAAALAEGADFLMAETVASLVHLRAVLEGMAGAGLPFWVSLTVDDHEPTRLRSGEPLSRAVPLAVEGGAGALLLNCSSSGAVGAGLGVIAGSGLPYGAYANGFGHVTSDFLAGRSSEDAPPDPSPEAYAGAAMGWVAAGATIVGGCCGVGPAHIAELARQLRAAGHRIVAPRTGQAVDTTGAGQAVRVNSDGTEGPGAAAGGRPPQERSGA